MSSHRPSPHHPGPRECLRAVWVEWAACLRAWATTKPVFYIFSRFFESGCIQGVPEPFLSKIVCRIDRNPACRIIHEYLSRHTRDNKKSDGSPDQEVVVGVGAAVMMFPPTSGAPFWMMIVPVTLG